MAFFFPWNFLHKFLFSNLLYLKFNFTSILQYMLKFSWASLFFTFLQLFVRYVDQVHKVSIDCLQHFAQQQMSEGKFAHCLEKAEHLSFKGDAFCEGLRMKRPSLQILLSPARPLLLLLLQFPSSFLCTIAIQTQESHNLPEASQDFLPSSRDASRFFLVLCA